MRRDHHPFAQCDRGSHRFFPKGQNSFNGVFQAFAQRHLVRLQFGVAPVAAFTARVCGRHGGRRYVVAAPPEQHLIIAKFFGGLSLVQPLQVTVVPLIEPPAVDHR